MVNITIAVPTHLVKAIKLTICNPLCTCFHDFPVVNGSILVIAFPEIQITQDHFFVYKEFLGLVPIDSDVEIASYWIKFLVGKFFCEVDQGVKQGIKTNDWIGIWILNFIHIFYPARYIRYSSKMDTQLKVNKGTQSTDIRIALVELRFSHLILSLHFLEILKNIIAVQDQLVERSGTCIRIVNTHCMCADLAQVLICILGTIQKICPELIQYNISIRQSHEFTIDSQDCSISIVYILIHLALVQCILGFDVKNLLASC